MKILTKATTIPSDLETPVGIYLKIRDLYPQSALLESSDYHTSHNSVSYLGVAPRAYFRVSGGVITATYPDGTVSNTPITPLVDVVEHLRSYVRSYEIESLDGKPCDANGLFGYTAYDCVRYFESVAIQPREGRLAYIPDMVYMMYRFVIEVNHYKSEMTIYENLLPGENSSTDELLTLLHNHNMAQYPFHPIDDVESTLTDDEYKEIVRQGIRHALRGDVFQIVLSRRFSQGFTGDELNVYRALRCVNPSPYLFFFDFGDFKVFGSSPETHLRVKGHTAYIDPIAGTFKRTGDDVRDHELAKALLEDQKENAEHIMLVDLARNDLARSGGHVEIDFLRQIQYYSHVIHMVSRVKATLPADANVYRLFADTFPAGTLSGAPKVRAMQLIDELEPHSRVVYGGCIGHLAFNGDLNQAITIRSFLSAGNRLYFQAGAGIVAHSVPENELQETNNKLGALRKALDFAKDYYRS
ncbi:MAG: anthranilate synthase component I family protein [Bacteroidales bacterium]|nr:anthranilate synthase component I family protein [Bacteroidales bacterium]